MDQEEDTVLPETEDSSCAPSDCSTCPGCQFHEEEPIQVGQVNPPESGEPVDPTTAFDISRKLRQEALTHVKEVLDREASGSKLSRKDIVKATKNLLYHAVYLDELVVILLQEMYRIVQAVAQQEVNDFSLRANLKTIVVALDKKGLVTESELAEIFNKEVLPAELSKVSASEEINPTYTGPTGHTAEEIAAKENQ